MKRLQLLPYKRKIKGKTNYRKRLILLKSRKARLVVRRALNNILLQIVQHLPDGDKVIVSIHSSSLKKFGWDLHRGNISAAYLSGLLCGKLAKEKKIDDAVADIGLYKSVRGSVQYAAVKGVIDSGLKISCSEEMFPDPKKISSGTDKSIAKKFEEVKNKIIGGKK